MKKKNDITLSISKNFATIFDHRLDLIEAHNEGTFEAILGFWIFFPDPPSLIFLIFYLKTRS